MKLKTLLIAVTATMISGMAQASLLVGSAGGNGTVVDTTNNAEWLRLDLTANQTAGTALTNYGSLGFTFATQTQLNKLLDQFFGIYGGEPGTRAGDFAFGATTTAGAESSWNRLFGLTYDSGGFRESLGLYDDGDQNTNETWYGFNSNPATYNATLAPPISDIGVFLVRGGGNNVPEPTSLALLGLGLFSMVGLRRRKSV